MIIIYLMQVIKEQNEKTIRAYIDKSLYEKMNNLIEKASQDGMELLFRDIILKGLELKEAEIAKIKVSCALKKENYDKFLKLKRGHKNLLIEDVVRAGIKETIDEYKKTIKSFV